MEESTIDHIGERTDSCKISINAKGQLSAEIKSYAETLEEAIKISLKKAAELKIIINDNNKVQND